MKLKKVAALCSANNVFCLFDDVRSSGEIRQWLGDGTACYLLAGLPVLDEDNVCAMFDIPEKKRKKCLCKREPMQEGFCTEDWTQGEHPLNTDWPTVECDGMIVKPLSTMAGMSFIHVKHLTPLEDMADYMSLYERMDAGGNKYIVAKNGMEIVAIILPVEIVSESFVRKLENLAGKCRTELEKAK